MKLDEPDHRALMLWAADCAERVLAGFEELHPGDDRPRNAIETRAGGPSRENAMFQALGRTALFSVVLVMVAAGTAWAHVGVEPEEVSAGDYEKLTVTVPTEKEVPTTEIRVEIPEGFVVSGVKPVESWEYEFEEDGGLITAVT